MTVHCDVITVGGGLGGASIAKVLAEKGLSVLVTEREETFKDRIRGEFLAPWGVGEAQKLGLYELLMEKCAHEQPFINFGGTLRDYRATTPHQLPALTFFHAAMQEIVLDAPRHAGAEVRRGVNVKQVYPGQPPSVSVESRGVTHDLTARIVIRADGRSSMGRSWGGFEVHRGKQRMLGAGVMFEGLSMSNDTIFVTLSPGVQRMAFMLPQGGGPGTRLAARLATTTIPLTLCSAMHVTALFADIKGSTELMEELDPEEARSIIDPALKLMIDAAHRYDGYVVQSTGDGIFALFGAPVAREDHPQRALYAALRRLQEDLKRYSDRIRQEGRLPPVASGP